MELQREKFTVEAWVCHRDRSKQLFPDKGELIIERNELSRYVAVLFLNEA